MCFCNTLLEHAGPESSLTGGQDSCLATEMVLPSASSYFLHTPLPDLGEFTINTGLDTSALTGTTVSGTTSESNVAMVTGHGTEVVTSSLPLLLNPELMKGTGIQIIPQVHVSNFSPLEWNSGMLTPVNWLFPCMQLVMPAPTDFFLNVSFILACKY